MNLFSTLADLLTLWVRGMMVVDVPKEPPRKADPKAIKAKVLELRRRNSKRAGGR